MECVTHWNMDPVAFIFQEGNDMQTLCIKIAEWRSAALSKLELLKTIMSFKTKQNGHDPIIAQAGPLKKDLEDRPVSLTFHSIISFLHSGASPRWSYDLLLCCRSRASGQPGQLQV